MIARLVVVSTGAEGEEATTEAGGKETTTAVVDAEEASLQPTSTSG